MLRTFDWVGFSQKLFHDASFKHMPTQKNLSWQRGVLIAIISFNF